jgi:thiol-disulfide isomerase/thioredoxin
MPRHLLTIVACGVVLAVASSDQIARGQAPGVPIEFNGSPNRNDDWRQQAAALKESGQVIGVTQVREQLESPQPAELTLPPPRTRPVVARTIVNMARAAYVRIGWYGKTENSDQWNLTLSGGYAITADGVVATCFHCVEPPRGTTEGYLVALTPQGQMRPVTKIVAAHRTLDACLVKVDGNDFQPLPLSDQLYPGDAVYCFSDPFSQNGYFSAGIANRFYWQKQPEKDATGLASVENLRLNVSTDWAIGSSGAAIVNMYGNVVGHVARIRPMGLGRTTGNEAQDRQRRDAGTSVGPTVLVMHEAIPARGVMALARGGRVEAPPAIIAAPTTTPSTPAEPPKPTLEIGMPAPKLQIAKFVQGEPVTEFESGTAYVVEFWATWCGPCIVTIPHLNELHEKFVNQGLVVIGQDIWQREETQDATEEKVREFIKARDGKMTYRVALDDKSQEERGAMAKTWMEAAGQNGIPSAFVIGKDGKIAWIGHPSRLNEQILSSVLDGTFDVAASKKEFELQRQIQLVLRSKATPVLIAIRGEKWDDAAKLIDELEAALPEGHRYYADQYRFNMALGRKDGILAAKVADKIAAGPNVVPMQFNDLAWRMIITPGMQDLDLALAERLARKGMELTEGETRANVMDTLARVLFLQDKKDEAIALQEQAVEKANERLKEQMQKVLEAYKKGELPEAK